MDSFNFKGGFSQHADHSHSHSHACIIFDTLKSYRRVAFNFIREGLDENEKCIMAVDSYHKSLITEDFAMAGLDIEAYLQNGRVAIIDVRTSYSKNVGFDPDSTIEIWKDESMRAASEGFNALRVVGEGTFALEGPGLYEKLIYYENIMNQVLFKKYPFKSLCVYEKKRYPAEVIKAVIQAHPVLFYNEEVFFENIHYVPPEIHFKKEETHDEIDRWLKNVRKNNKNLKDLKARNERMYLALDFSNEGVWDWNLNTNEIYFSPNCKKLLGYRNNEIKNDFYEWERLTRPEHVKKAWKEFEDIISKKRDHFEVEFQMRHKDGRWIDILSRANVVFDSKGKAFRMVGTHVDITGRKKAEEELKRLNETLEQQVAERTELAEIRARQLQTLAVELLETEERERQRIAELLHDDLQQMLASARFQLQTVGVTLENEPILVTVNEILEESIAKSRRLSHELSPPVLHHGSLYSALEWLGHQMNEQFGLTIELADEKSPNLENTHLKVFIFRAVQELLFNIVKHADVKSARVLLSGSNGNVAITISDQGRGFNKDIIDLSSEKRGFGLISIRERAQRIGGNLKIESTPGQGSRFVLVLPLQAAPAKVPVKTGELTDAVVPKSISIDKRLRVLFADDHKVMRQGLIRLIAGQTDIEVAGEAANGQEAVELARRVNPDVIVMDISMPVMDGIEATRLIKSEFPEVRIMGLSMFEDEQSIKSIISAGADAFVPKTASSEEFVNAIYGIEKR